MTIPTNLWDLTEEEWRGKVAIPSPVSSSPGRAFMLATIDYFSGSGNNNSSLGWEQWWSAMEENDVIITSGWSEAYGMFLDNKADLVLSYSTSPFYHREYEDEYKYLSLIHI